MSPHHRHATYERRQTMHERTRPMFHGLRTQLAFAIATAAIVGASLAPIAPAFAATLAPSQDHELAAPKKPDVAVAIIDTDYYGVDQQHFHATFRIDNIGKAVSSAVPVKAECVYADTGATTKHWVALATVLAPIQVGDPVFGHFTCEDATGARVT